MKKRLTALTLVACLFLSLAACKPATVEPTPTPTPTATPTATVAPTATPTPVPSESVTPAEKTKINLAVLNGPTGMGAVKLMSDNEADAAVNAYTVTMAADNQEVAGLLTKGDIDIAAMASNVAAGLFHKTDGAIETIALGTLGVLYILENGDAVKTMDDLAGRTIYAVGQGANPEYILNYLLQQNGLEAGGDVNIEWKTAEEVTALMASGKADLCMLPVPAATAVLAKNDKVRSALDLTAEWNKVQPESQLTMTSVVVRRAFAQEHPEAVDAFLKEYAASIDYVNGNVDAAAELMAQYKLTPNAAIAKKAIPQANLVCITGADVQPTIQGYYEVLFAADAKSIGGSIPDDSFYYAG